MPPPPQPAEGQRLTARGAAQLTEKERELKQEAESGEHLLTHLPFNPMCDYCREAKLRAKPARRKRDPQVTEAKTRFGQLVCCDHMVLGADQAGLGGERYPFSIYDAGTKFLALEGCSRKTAAQAAEIAPRSRIDRAEGAPRSRRERAEIAPSSRRD